MITPGVVGAEMRRVWHDHRLRVLDHSAILGLNQEGCCFQVGGLGGNSGWDHELVGWLVAGGIV